MRVSYDVTETLRAQMNGHPPLVLVYDARGNGGGYCVPYPHLTGDHQNRVTDYTAIVVEVKDGNNRHDSGSPHAQS